MHVGIVIPAFNVAPWLGDAIRSVLSQTHSDWSLAVVDDGSTDATSTVATALLDRRIRLIRQPNSGVSAARNRGLAMVAAEATLFLDGDDWLAPDALEIMSTTLAASPGAVAVASGYARLMAGGRMRHIPPPSCGQLLHRLLVGNLFVNGGQVLIRRAAVDSAGGFNPNLAYGEDWEFWTRLALQGPFIALATPKPLLFVRERAGSAYRCMATDPTHFTPSMNAVFANPDIIARVGRARLVRLRKRAEAEIAWVVGREMIRHGRWKDGQAWLLRSLRATPGFKRLGLLGLSCLRAGPFQGYEAQRLDNRKGRRFGNFTSFRAN